MLTYMEAMLTCWVDMHLMHDRRLPLLAMPCLLSLTTLLIRYIILSTLLNLPTLLNPHAMLSLTDGWLGGLPRHTAASNRARPIIDDHMEGLEDGEQVFVQASARVACCRADAADNGKVLCRELPDTVYALCTATTGPQYDRSVAPSRGRCRGWRGLWRAHRCASLQAGHSRALRPQD